MNESIIIAGNGLTLDTYGKEYQEIIIADEKVWFFIKNNKKDLDNIFSSKYYPDLYNFAKNKDFYTIGKEILETINFLHTQHPFGDELWSNIALFNSLCDYLYKLFWLYNRKTKKIDTKKEGINLFCEKLNELNKNPIFIDLNYDLNIERHLMRNKKNIFHYGFQKNKLKDQIMIFKPHGAINFMSNVNDPNDSGFCSANPFYPITNDANINIAEKNPLWFNNYSENLSALGILINKEMPMYSIEIVPPGCSNLINQQYGRNQYLIPWAHDIYINLFGYFANKKNLIIIGVSFWQEDEWELIRYISSFLESNKNGHVYILAYNDQDYLKIFNILIRENINLNKIQFLHGSFSENYEELLTYI